eukprot:CCRYP_007651-RA/>CCRYP_007651-RA protein AED:0.45 eAED:0.66 QI:0/0.5/0/1/0/0/3/0/140
MTFYHCQLSSPTSKNPTAISYKAGVETRQPFGKKHDCVLLETILKGGAKCSGDSRLNKTSGRTLELHTWVLSVLVSLHLSIFIKAILNNADDQRGAIREPVFSTPLRVWKDSVSYGRQTLDAPLIIFLVCDEVLDQTAGV